MLFPGDREPVAAVHGPRVAEQLTKEVRQEVVEDLLFLELVRPAGGQQLRPVLELGAGGCDLFREGEGRQVRAEHVGTEQGFRFNGQERVLPTAGLFRNKPASA